MGDEPADDRLDSELMPDIGSVVEHYAFPILISLIEEGKQCLLNVVRIVVMCPNCGHQRLLSFRPVQSALAVRGLDRDGAG